MNDYYDNRGAVDMLVEFRDRLDRLIMDLETKRTDGVIDQQSKKRNNIRTLRTLAWEISNAVGDLEGR